MASLRAIPRASFALILSALIIAAAISFGAVYTARGVPADTTYYACLYAGSLSQVGTTPPSNCGRGDQIQWDAVGPEGLQGPAGPEGPVGPEGPTGPQGESGVTGLTTVVSRFSPTALIAPNEESTRTAFCFPGEIATGGGYESGPSLRVFRSRHDGAIGFPATAWIVQGVNTSATDSVNLTTFALCASTEVAAP